MLRNSTESREKKSIVVKYLVTAPIERPQRPIQETCLLLRRKDTAHLRSCFWEYRNSNVFQNTAIKIYYECCNNYINIMTMHLMPT